MSSLPDVKDTASSGSLKRWSFMGDAAVKLSRARIIDLRRIQIPDPASRIGTARNPDSPIRQESGRMFAPRGAHAAGFGEDTTPRIVQFRA